MRAGEHDGVGAAAVFVDKAGGDFVDDLGIGDRRACEFAFGNRREIGRADQHDIATAGEFADERLGIFARHGRLRAEHGNTFRLRLRAGRLDRRHGADKGHAVARAQLGKRQHRRRIAGDDHEIGLVRVNRLADDIDNARDQRAFRLIAIGKTGIVGDINEMRIGARAQHFAIDGQPADAGIENHE